VTQATGVAERETALAMARNLPAGATLGADKGYDVAGFVDAFRALGVTPHVVQNTTHRRSASNGRTTRIPATA
jgi:IS5 family transposase